jgi:hypothetical protein
MRKLISAAALGLLLVLSACSYLNQPPTVIYPDRNENPSAYKIDPWSQ